MTQSPAQTSGAAVQVETIVDRGLEDLQHGCGDHSLQVCPALSGHIHQPPHLLPLLFLLLLHLINRSLSWHGWWQVNIELVYDVLIHVEVIVLDRGTFIVSHFPVRIYLLVNIIKIVVILVVVVVVEVVGDVRHHGEDADRHGEEGHL